MTAEIPLSIGSADVAVAPNGKRAYVVDASTDSLTEVDLAAFAVTGRIPVGHRPSRIAITPDGRWAYVVGSPTVAVDLASGSRLFITDLPIVDLAIDNDGRFVFFALGQSIENIGLAVFDSATGTVTPAVPGYAAAGVALSFDGRYVYLAGNSPGSVNTRVLTVDAVSLAVLHDVLVPTWPYLGLMDDIAVTPEGKTLYVTASPYTDAGTLLVLDAATAEVRKVLHNVYGRLAMAPAGERLYLSNNQSGNLLMLDTATDLVTASMSIGTGARGVTASLDGKFVQVAADDGLYTVDAFTNRVVGRVPSGAGPTGIAASPDGNLLYVANNASGNVGVIDAQQRRLIGSIQTGGKPLGIVVAPDGRRVYVSSFTLPGSVFVIDATTNTQVATITVPGEAGGIALAPDGRLLFVSNHYAGTVSVIDTDSNTVLTQFEVGYQPKDIAISRDGGFGIVGTEVSAALNFFDASRADPTRSPVLGSLPLNAASEPCGIALSFEGDRAYVTDVHASFVFAVDLTTRSLRASTSIAAPYIPRSCGIRLTADDRRAYVANTANNVVTVLDTSDFHVLHHIPVLPAPYEVVITCPGGCPTPTPLPTATATPTPPLCLGDCNRDGRITVDELLTAVEIALGDAALSDCPRIDSDEDGSVTVDEVLAAVAAALLGCRPIPDQGGG